MMMRRAWSLTGDPAYLSNRHDHHKGRARATCSPPPCRPAQRHRLRTLPAPCTARYERPFATGLMTRSQLISRDGCLARSDRRAAGRPRQRFEHGREGGVGAGGKVGVGQELNRVRDVDHAGARHAEPAGLLDGFVGERCRRYADRRDAPALQVNQVMQTARRA